jgi:hypothetical protein
MLSRRGVSVDTHFRKREGGGKHKDGCVWERL